MQRAEEQLGALGAAGAEQPAEADRLAGVQREIERRHNPAAAEALGDQERLARPTVAVRVGGIASTASSSRPSISGTSLGQREFRRRAHADAAAVAQHRQPIGDRVDLFEKMRNEHDGEAARPQIANDVEQPRRLGRVETSGRLVEHQHARVVFQRARDGDELLHGDRNRSRAGARRRCQAERLRAAARASTRAAANRRGRSGSAAGRA